MYRILRSEMVKYDISSEDLAKYLEISVIAMSKKLNGHINFSLIDAKKIRDLFNRFGNNYTIDYLFFTEVSKIVNEATGK